MDEPPRAEQGPQGGRPRLAAARSDPAAGRDGDEGREDREGRGMSLWHVSVTFAGSPVPRAELHEALLRLVEAHPFLASVRYGDDRAEVSYWDEAEDVDDAAALALRLWAEHRRAADLPDWHAVAVEVVDRDTLHARGQRLPAPTTMGEVRPW